MDMPQDSGGIVQADHQFPSLPGHKSNASSKVKATRRKEDYYG